jgi:hypothetical protein
MPGSGLKKAYAISLRPLSMKPNKFGMSPRQIAHPDDGPVLPGGSIEALAHSPDLVISHQALIV